MMTSSKHRKFTFNCLLRYLTGSYSSDFKARQYIYIIVKVSKLDFNYRDICIFNIVNELMIRELHLAHLFVTRYIHYQRFLQLLKKGENVLKFKNFRNVHQL